VPGPPEPRPAELAAGRGTFPFGAAVTRADLDAGLHPVLARLRAAEPVSWLPVLGGWLVTSRELALRVLRDGAAFTVDDPRFSTARVVGPSMLSLDEAEHGRHRAPFSHGFSHREIRSRLAGYVTAEADRLVAGLAPAGAADLRLGLAAPLAAAVMAQALGLGEADPGTLLGWYSAIVAAVSDLAGAPDALVSPAGAAAFRMLDASLREVVGSSGPGQSLLADAAQGALAATGAPASAGSGPPTGSLATGEIDVSWTDPSLAAEAIAGYNVYVSWIDPTGVLQTSATFVPFGSDAATLAAVPGVTDYTVSVVAVDPQGREGAYPGAGTGFSLS